MPIDLRELESPVTAPVQDHVEAETDPAVPDPVRQQLEAAAQACGPVALVGEAGTGKQVLARWLHDRSPRRREPFVALDGGQEGALPALLGAVGSGTLLVRDVADLSFVEQVELVRALEGGQGAPVFSGRLVVTSVQTLPVELGAGRLRRELHAWISRAVVTVPPLRQRLRELPALARSILGQLCPPDREPVQLSDQALARLAAHDWPGNLDELWDVLCAAARDAPEGPLGAAQVRFRERTPAAAVEFSDELLSAPYKEAREALLTAFERAHATRWLESFQGNVARAAAAIGLSRQALHALLKRTGLSADDFRPAGVNRG